MKTKIDKIVASSENPNLASGVVVNGETLPADFVIMGVGVAPATEYLKDSGIQLEKDGGIRVDEYLRVRTGPDTKDVYAVGDIAIYPQQNGEETRIEHWNVAGNHGRAVGCTIAGKEQPFVKIPIFWSARKLRGISQLSHQSDSLPEGQQLRYCGVAHSFDRVIIRGSLEEFKVNSLSLDRRPCLKIDPTVCCLLCQRRQGNCSCKVNPVFPWPDRSLTYYHFPQHAK